MDIAQNIKSDINNHVLNKLILTTIINTKEYLSKIHFNSIVSSLI